jgi:hypothetical protein
MKTNRSIRLACLLLVVVSVAAGLGLPRLLFPGWSEARHQLAGAVGQLVPLVGLMVIAWIAENLRLIEEHPATTEKAKPGSRSATASPGTDKLFHGA